MTVNHVNAAGPSRLRSCSIRGDLLLQELARSHIYVKMTRGVPRYYVSKLKADL